MSIVIPALHEERRIGPTLDALAVLLKTVPYRRRTVEVIVVAADTVDKTKEIVLSKQSLFSTLTLLEPGKPVGKGRDVQYGILRARGRCVIFMDADLATPLHHIETFYAQCAAGNDIVIGTRNLLTYRSSGVRGIFAYVGNALYRLGGGMPVEDTQCGFKMFSAPAAKLCFSKLRIMGWGFDMELLAIAKANNLSLKTVRLPDWQHMPHSTHHESFARISLRSLKDFTLITTRRLRRIYEK